MTAWDTFTTQDGLGEGEGQGASKKRRLSGPPQGGDGSAMARGAPRGTRKEGTRTNRLLGFLGGWGLVLWCSGAWAWQWTLNGNANLTDEALAVTVDSQGQVVAAGYVSHVDTGAAFTVVKLDRASGVLLWQQTLDGTAHRLDGVDAVRVDRAG